MRRPPFDPRKAVERFAKVLKEYGVFSVTGDRYAGNTFASDFESHGVGYHVSELTTSQLYEALEPRLNAGELVLLDNPIVEAQFLGLVWRANRITHLSAEHDDHANGVAGVIHEVLAGRSFSEEDVWVGYTDQVYLDDPDLAATGWRREPDW